MYFLYREAYDPGVWSRQFDFPSLLSPIRSVNNPPRYVAILYHFSFQPLFLFHLRGIIGCCGAYMRNFLSPPCNYARVRKSPFDSRPIIINIMLCASHQFHYLHWFAFSQDKRKCIIFFDYTPRKWSFRCV